MAIPAVPVVLVLLFWGYNLVGTRNVVIIIGINQWFLVYTQYFSEFILTRPIDRSSLPPSAGDIPCNF